MLVADDPEPGCCSAGDRRAVDIGFSAVVSLVDDVRVIFPDTVVAGAGLSVGRIPGVW